MSVLTRKETITDDFHGTGVADPYRWLENAEASEVKEWTDAQNEVTQAFLKTYPEREQVKEKLTKSWNYPKYSVPQKEGDYFYFHKNDGLQNQAVFYRTKDLESDELETIIDPNTLNEGGTEGQLPLRIWRSRKMAIG